MATPAGIRATQKTLVHNRLRKGTFIICNFSPSSPKSTTLMPISPVGFRACGKLDPEGGVV
jgi:hypothetical protein